MPAIGITGGIATGKTALRDCLRLFVRGPFGEGWEQAREELL